MRHHIAHTFSTESPEDQDSLGRKRYLPKKRLLTNEQYYLPILASGLWASGSIRSVICSRCSRGFPTKLKPSVFSR